MTRRAMAGFRVTAERDLTADEAAAMVRESAPQWARLLTLTRQRREAALKEVADAVEDAQPIIETEAVTGVGRRRSIAAGNAPGAILPQEVVDGRSALDRGAGDVGASDRDRTPVPGLLRRAGSVAVAAEAA